MNHLSTPSAPAHESPPASHNPPSTTPTAQPQSVSTLNRLKKVPGRLLRRTRSVTSGWWERIDRVLVRWASRSRIAARSYYLFFSSEFGREQQAVLRGRARYAEDLQNPRHTSALLRRNVHGLEKGILMRPRRNRFAVDYIGVTMDCYEQLLSSAPGESQESDELQWAHDVLKLYFEITDDHPRIESARKRFRALPPPGTQPDRVLVPYCRDLAGNPPVAYEDLLRLAERRRSVRWFLQEPVDRVVIDKAITVARQCPSACNRQPFRFVVLDDPSLAQRVASISMGTAGYWQNIPVLVAVVGRLRSYFAERDRHLIYIDGALASMAFVFAIESLGLATCCINWPDVEEKEREIAEVLQLDPDERVTMLMAVGHPDPDGLVAYSQKKPLSQLRRYNFE